jgi:NUBPL iron-transfer P-loop NTPase
MLFLRVARLSSCNTSRRFLHISAISRHATLSVSSPVTAMRNAVLTPAASGKPRRWTRPQVIHASKEYSTQTRNTKRQARCGRVKRKRRSRKEHGGWYATTTSIHRPNFYSDAFAPAVNLAMSLALHPSRPRVGILDLDIFGPSIPKLMGLENIEDLALSPGASPSSSDLKPDSFRIEFREPTKHANRIRLPRRTAKPHPAPAARLSPVK